MTDPKLALILAATLLDGLAAFSGGLLPVEVIHRQITGFLAFAAGTLIGVAFLDLIPEALEALHHAHASSGAAGEPGYQGLMLAAALGFSAFYAIEHLAGSHAAGQTGHAGHHHHLTGPFILIGDALHNITDGMAIAAAFMADTSVGVATTAAVILHELPQEVSDYAILLSQGYSQRKALAMLGVVQLTGVLGAVATFTAAQWISGATPVILALSAGGFIYVAAANLLPELQRRRSKASALGVLAAFLAGLALIYGLQLLHPHG